MHDQFKPLTHYDDMYTITVSVTENSAKMISNIAEVIGTTPAGILHQMIENKCQDLYFTFSETEENE